MGLNPEVSYQNWEAPLVWQGTDFQPLLCAKPSARDFLDINLFFTGTLSLSLCFSYEETGVISSVLVPTGISNITFKLTQAVRFVVRCRWRSYTPHSVAITEGYGDRKKSMDAGEALEKKRKQNWVLRLTEKNNVCNWEPADLVTGRTWKRWWLNRHEGLQVTETDPEETREVLSPPGSLGTQLVLPTETNWYSIVSQNCRHLDII